MFLESIIMESIIMESIIMESIRGGNRPLGRKLCSHHADSRIGELKYLLLTVEDGIIALVNL